MRINKAEKNEKGEKNKQTKKLAAFDCLKNFIAT